MGIALQADLFGGALELPAPLPIQPGRFALDRHRGRPM